MGCYPPSRGIEGDLRFLKGEMRKIPCHSPYFSSSIEGFSRYIEVVFPLNPGFSVAKCPLTEPKLFAFGQ